MVLDTLSRRTPLYRLKEFFQEKDTELLLGSQIDSELFCDHNFGRVLDKIFDTGAHAIFCQLFQNAIKCFGIDTSDVHFDTTSISVYGDYELSEEPFKITRGHSKDHRPDLKQFLISMLCVNCNIPIAGAPKDGNASDKTLNNELLSNISKHMAKHGLKPGAFVYIADSAFVDALCKKIRSATYFCRPDAEAAQDKLRAAAIGSYHNVDCAIEKVAKFGRGRPVKGKQRKPI